MIQAFVGIVLFWVRLYLYYQWQSTRNVFQILVRTNQQYRWETIASELRLHHRKNFCLKPRFARASHEYESKTVTASPSNTTKKWFKRLWVLHCFGLTINSSVITDSAQWTYSRCLREHSDNIVEKIMKVNCEYIIGNTLVRNKDSSARRMNISQER